jgi:hypothetical protein
MWKTFYFEGPEPYFRSANATGTAAAPNGLKLISPSRVDDKKQVFVWQCAELGYY